MSAPNYKALARKYRPQSFSDLIGQDVLIRIISNAIKHNKIPHAILLTGIRGVGKTTSARIIARALNCMGADGSYVNPVAEPCGICQNCQSIAESRNPDVIEMDAASNTSVNDIRIIIDSIGYKPISGRYKIYIIDEVHMLSSSAFNALLKTLEEPPLHTKFIFATTELSKIPLTILSRCQKFYLKRLSTKMLSEYYNTILRKEKLIADQEALYLISKAADGSVRDGLSILDQAIALSEYNNISKALVEEMLGVVSKDVIYELFEFLVQGQIQNLLSCAASLYNEGADPVIITQQLLEIVHEITLFQNFPKRDVIDLSESNQEKIKDFAHNLDTIFLSRIWQMLIKGMEELTKSILQFECFEMILIRIAYANTVETPEEILNKISVGIETTATHIKNDIKNSDIHKTNIAPENTEIKNISSINNVHDLIALFAEHNEMSICYALQNDVYVISIENNTIKLSILQDDMRNIASILEQKLTLFTSSTWKVEIAQENDARSLTEMERIEIEESKQRALQSPIVQNILNKFPNMKIGKVENHNNS